MTVRTNPGNDSRLWFSLSFCGDVTLKKNVLMFICGVYSEFYVVMH